MAFGSQGHIIMKFRLLDSVKSPSLSLIICEQVRWFALKIVLIALFCNRSEKSEFFLEQDPYKIQP